MTNELRAFIEASRECLKHCEKMLEGEREKRKALVVSDAEKIEAALKTQQASAMQLENLERKRIDAQNAAGYSNRTASEIIAEVADPEAARELNDIYVKWKATVAEIKDYNEKSMELATANLKLYEALVSGPVNETKSPTYGPKGHKGTNSPNSSFEEKI